MRWFALSLVCVVVTGVAATAATARTSVISVTTAPTAPLQTALDDPIFQSSQRGKAFELASQAGTTWARIIVSWRSIAPLTLPSPSSLFVATNPNSPYYHWSSLDATVAAAAAHGVQPMLDIVGPPSWGYHVSPNPKKFLGGQPDVTDLGQFATALASRYPGVHAFSVWNEPNFNRNLSPQDPVYYRYMVNAVADAVHGVNPSNLALAGELAPFKHANSKKDPNNVIAPITWMQQMLCVSATSPAHATSCGIKPRFDVWTHHPYSDTGPFGHARVSGGVELGDLPKMNKLLQTAWNLGTITTQSGQAPQFWVTEIGWSSNPPNKHGVPMKLETRWTAEAFYQLWKSGATLGTWFLLQDEPTSTPFQSGLYSLSGSLSSAVAKPLLTPYKFPFVAYFKSGGKVLVWGRDTTSDTQTVEIDMKVGSKWKHVADVKSNSYGIFTATLPVHAKSTYSMRASAPGSGTSATFTLKPPANENLRVTPFPLN